MTHALQKLTISERSLLTSPHSDKVTMHVALHKGGEPFSFEVGDCLAIYPENDQEIVDSTLKAMGLSGDEKVVDPKKKDTLSFREFLQTRVNLQEPSFRLVKMIWKNYPTDTELTNLFNDETGENLKKVMQERSLWKWVARYPMKLSTEEWVSLFSPLLPRFYSIASSPTVHPKEVHLTVSYVNYEVNGEKRRGVGSHYLCSLAPLHQPRVESYFQPHKGFTLPKEHTTPIIMVGPGTGVAPFRAFLQERMHSQTSGKQWLFFGERTESHEFLYKDFFLDLVSSNKLTLHTAFSRQGKEKVYVQHRMRENAKELYQWLQSGAYFYVCGDAKRMAKDVEETLLDIFMQEGGLTLEEARKHLSSLRKEGRYLRDVY